MIYFDNAATTKPNTNALNKAMIFNAENYFNPSALYKQGLDCKKEINKAKESILKNLSALNHEVIFTSCGTESDNQAIFCAVKKGVFLTDKGEHSAVYKSFQERKLNGDQVVFIDLNPDGSVNEDKLYDYVRENRVDFVSIMHVNNETGAINNVNKIAKTVKSINPKIIFHSDGVQAYGKLPYQMSNDIDLYSISAHKIGGLKGNGALLKNKKIYLGEYLIGGGQENGLRSGTENVFGIKVFEYAGCDKYKSIKENYGKVKEINDYIRNNIDKNLLKVISGENASPYVLSLSAVGLRGEVVMHSLETEGIIVGNGSACSSKNRYSRVLEACGYKNDVLDGVIRISFCSDSTLSEAKIFVEAINRITKKLKGIMR